MPRPPIARTVGGVPRHTLFKPAGIPARELEHLALAVDELEAIRLVDFEGLSHEQAAVAMGVSRQTIGRVLEHGRAQVAEALVTGKAILIGGGQYRVEARVLCCASCGAAWTEAPDGPPPDACPDCGAPTVSTCWHEGRHEGRRGNTWRGGRCRGRATTYADANNQRTE
ncbi:MAG: DUF134 domain-containing protein [Thermoleophilia bacterium]